MSRLKELIERLCPDGVEYKPLGELGTFERGNGLQKKDFTENGVGCIHYGQIYTYYSTFATETKSFVSEELANKLLPIFPGNLVIACTSENVEDVGKAVAWLGTETIVTGGHSVVFRHSLNPKYIAYFFQTENFFIQKKKFAFGAKVIDIKAADLAKIVIPVPPIEVQEEIVRILDTFSAYAASLQAELQARKEQYEYYRNLLLTFNPSACGCGTDGEQEIKVTTCGGGNYEVIWKTMGEIGKFIRGKRFVRTDIVEHGIPCIHYGDMYTHYGLYASETPGYINEEIAKKMRFAEKNDVIIVAAGENKEDLGNALAWLGDEPAAVHDACFIFKSEMNPNYLSHVCRTRNYHKQVRKFANEAKICSVSGADLSKVVIPLPPYELQVKIASILNRFETLVNDLTQGLPAEIAAVRERYEHYRNKLLTFKRIA